MMPGEYGNNNSGRCAINHVKCAPRYIYIGHGINYVYTECKSNCTTFGNLTTGIRYGYDQRSVEGEKGTRGGNDGQVFRVCYTRKYDFAQIFVVRPHPFEHMFVCF